MRHDEHRTDTAPRKPEHEYYEQREIWGKGLHNYQRQVLDAISHIMPADVGTILDVGCGDGYITNPLSEKYHVTGMDISHEALKYVACEKVVGDITQIPFPDASFDLVMTNDVLEHINEAEFEQALSELFRVAKKYVLVTVPNEEDVDNKSVVCPHCGGKYHINWHQRSFSKERVASLFHGRARAAALVYSGEPSLPPHNPLVGWNHLIHANYQWEGAVCPHCGEREDARTALNKNALFAVRQKLWQEEPYQRSNIWSEITCLFAKGEGCADAAPSGMETAPRISRGSLLDVDFTNRLQCLTEIGEGQRWTRWQPLRNVGYAETGVFPQGGDEEPAYLRLYYPAVNAGDELILRGEGLSEERVTMVGIDGVFQHETSLYAENASASELTLRLDDTFNSTQFGYQFDLYLSGDCSIREIIHRGEACPAADFWQVEPGFQCMSVGEGTKEYVAISAESGGKVPLLLDSHQVREAPAREVYTDIINVYTRQIRRQTDTLESCGKRIAALNEALETREAQREHLNTLLNEKEAQREHLNTLLNEKEAQQEQLSALLNEKEAQREHLNTLLNEKEAANQLLEGRNHALKLEKRALEARVQELCARRVNKVLILSNMFPTESDPIGGSFIHEQVKALRQYGDIDARVISCKPFWLNGLNLKNIHNANRYYAGHIHEIDWAEYDSVPVLYLPYKVGNPLYSVLIHSWTYTSAVLEVIDKVWKEFKFELIHAHTSHLDGNAARAVSKRYQIPYVLTEHMGPFSIYTDKPVVKQRALSSIKHANEAWAVSGALRGSILSHYTEGEGVQMGIMHNGVDVSRFRLSRKTPDFSKSIDLMYIGYLEEIKNLPNLFNAFKLLLERYPTAILRLVGDGPLHDSLVSLAEQLGISRQVVFCGAKNREEVAELLSTQCDIFILPSRAETFGVVLIEAMASGVPIAATRCGGPEDIVTEEVGVLCENDNSESLYQAIAHIIENYGKYDKEAIRRSAEQRFSFQSVAQALLSKYQQHG